MATYITFVVLLTIFLSVSSLPFKPDNSRIVGGETASPGQFPYQISLYLPAYNVHYASGSIIRPNWILTAAHCFDYFTKSDLLIVAGAHRTINDGTTYEIADVIMHEDYVHDEEDLSTDIALARTSETIVFGLNVATISIGDGSFVNPGVQARISGWGNTYYEGPPPDELQYLDLVTLSNADCKSRMYEWLTHWINDGLLCAYSNNVGQGICHGDSGGPLVSNGTQIGIVSFAGQPCASGRPDGFTRVSVFVPWILAHVGPVEITDLSATKRII